MNKKSAGKGKKSTEKAPRLKLINRELSWLSFNERVLQEASDLNVPLLERIKFLGIFSNNLDEFFRVRVAGVRRIVNTKQISNTARKQAKKTLEAIIAKVIQQQKKFDKIYTQQILPQLRENGIQIVDEKSLTEAELKSVRQHFTHVVSQKLFPIILDESRGFPVLNDGDIYLAIKLYNRQSAEVKYAIVGIPAKALGRFYILPGKSETSKIILLDDILRCSLDVLFKSLDFDEFTAHTIKITRDAELDLDSELATPLREKLEKSLKQRKTGAPTRFLYDANMPEDLLQFFTRKLFLDKDNLIAGGKYHNFRDFIKFPHVGSRELRYAPFTPARLRDLDQAKSLLNEIEKRDILLSYPYQTFDYIIRLLREAAIDPTVYSIHISLYRIAENSSVVEALINAAQNGKQVVVLMELRARFMEEHNIWWYNKLKEEGIKVIEGIPNRKVHSKLIVISRRKNFKTTYCTHIGTGNFNEETARIYCDFSLLTSRKKISQECLKVFDMIMNFEPEKFEFNTLWVSPVNTRSNFEELVHREMVNVKRGLPARMIIKLNSLVDDRSCVLLYIAARAGVKVDLIVRGICCLPLTGEPNIRAISIVDRYLEHSRIYYFENGGKPEVYIGSADLMQRNIEYRVEVTTPILDKEHRELLTRFLEVQLNDNVKARVLDGEMQNKMVKLPANAKLLRSQEEFQHLFRRLADTPNIQ
ncbi:MAG: polyphosphate kinase 1 [Bacteroidetes bacterium]|nr:polyphosphate kinase 1 [Bacteroidota bacterium]